MRLIWTKRALRDLERLSDRLPGQGAAVYEAMRRMADIDFSLGHSVSGTKLLYWPVPPQGVFYRVSRDGRDLIVMAISDARRRRRSLS